MRRIGLLNHSPISFYFCPNPRDFVVQEIPLYQASGKGEHIYALVRKKCLTTHEVLDVFSTHLGIQRRCIGYAGLKDKHALTSQMMSFPKKYKIQLENFTHPLIKILQLDYHDNKIRIGHLRGNHFFMRLKRLNTTDALKIQSVINIIQNQGFANYFGYQRFGNEGNNYVIAQHIEQGMCTIRNKVKRQFFFSAWQSKIFNDWLAKRIHFSHIIAQHNRNEVIHHYPFLSHVEYKIFHQSHPFILLPGDVMQHYPIGKIFNTKDVQEESIRFKNKSIVPTGILVGKKTLQAIGLAYDFEKNLLTSHSQLLRQIGGRRFAWVFPQDIEFTYIKQKSHGHLHFFLPKGSYATVFLEQLTNTELSPLNKPS